MKRGIKVLAMFENGVRHMTNNRNPIRKPEDVKGLKIRVMEQPIYIEMRSSGRNPMAFGELFTAMQQGVVDGEENPAALFSGSSRYRSTSLTAHTYSAEPSS